MTRPQATPSGSAAPSGPRRWPIVAGVAGLGLMAAVLAFLLLRPSDETADASPTPSPTLAASPTPALNQDLLSKRLTVLLLGLDSSEARRANNKGVNSDSIMLASINADQSEV